jgi:membrane associated rhomboid family serine protease
VKKTKKSTVSAFLALVCFCWLFCLGLSSRAIYWATADFGLLSSSALAVYYWRKERKADAKTSAVGIWIVLGVFLLFIVLCLVLPALG